MGTQMTLVFLIDDAKDLILLGIKKTGFGQGRVLGIGGKVDLGETVIAAACREVLEEVSVTLKPEDLVKGGEVEFIFPEKTGWHHEVHIYTCKIWQGTPTESPEIKPQWVAISEIPYEKMWDDAKYWLPKILNQEKVKAKIFYGDDLKTVSSVQWL
jgi:8-oxo-dGTP diphosphatase